MESATANERHKCGRVHRAHYNRSWYPAPGAVNECPSSVVEWREAPGFVFYPGPAPRRYPHPVSVAIRSPVGRNAIRGPNRSVVGGVVPASVIVEVFVTRHL